MRLATPSFLPDWRYYRHFYVERKGGRLMEFVTTLVVVVVGGLLLVALEKRDNARFKKDNE